MLLGHPIKQTYTATGEPNMRRPLYYSPRISRLLVSVLYYEAKHRQIPMTKLADELLNKQLLGSEGWRKVNENRLAENPTNQDRSQ
jgi:hypothetical protein